MHTPQPRHHRKAGSGPAADALITWIGTDPYLREVATLATWRRVAAAPPRCRTRSVRAAVVVCCVLTGGAVLSMTTLSDERGVAQHKIVPPPVDQSRDAASVPTSSSTVSAHAGSHPVLSIPASRVPRLATPATPPTSTAPAVDQHTAPVVAKNQSDSPRPVHPRATEAIAADKPTGLGEPGDHSQRITIDPREKTETRGNFGHGDQPAGGDSGELSLPDQTGNARSRPPVSTGNLTSSADRNTPGTSRSAVGHATENPVVDKTTNGIVPTAPRWPPNVRLDPATRA
jgi:hypothetical protein